MEVRRSFFLGVVTLVTGSAMLWGCATRHLNGADADLSSLADAKHILGIVKNPDGVTFSFELCRRAASGKPIASTCTNPFLDAEQKPAQFVTLPATRDHFEWVGKGKAVAVAIGGVVFIAVAAGTVGAGAGIVAASTSAGFGGLAGALAVFPMAATAGGVAGTGALMYTLHKVPLWGREERELARNYESFLAKDSLGAPALVTDVTRLLPSIAGALRFTLK